MWWSERLKTVDFSDSKRSNAEMKIKYVLAAVLILLAGGVGAALVEETAAPPVQNSSPAPQDPQWEADMKRLGELGASQKDCDERWNILWPRAKKGNLEARLVLFMQLMPGPHQTGLFPPGSTKDMLSAIRDGTIVAIHSVGNKYEEMDRLLYGFYYELPRIFFGFSREFEEFAQCAKEKRSQDCIKIAVDAHLVPTFEVFAEQIDALVAQGKKPTCR